MFCGYWRPKRLIRAVHRFIFFRPIRADGIAQDLTIIIREFEGKRAHESPVLAFSLRFNPAFHAPACYVVTR